MDKYTSNKLVKDTFESDFDKNRFYYFIKNLLNNFDETKAFHARGYVQEKYKKIAGIIKTYERIGTYTDPNENKIDILIVYLVKNDALERARTTLRNFVADYLKNRDEKDAGLVAFVSPDNQDWRFSLVKMEYNLVESPTGKIKAKEEFTSAKRYSFLVGINESSHTAQSRLAPILEGEYKPTLEQLEYAFNIEKVTDEFFERYRELFLKVKESLDEIVEKDETIKLDFKQKGVDPVDFSKKLLGQIVFLYFLQKKGWFGVERDSDWGTGPKNFLRLLFERMIANYKNFFNDILEPLFYEALAKERDDDFYSRFNCKIPFLNGGLFDPLSDYDWVHTDILLPDELFSNLVRTKEGDTGTGILDIFDRYNFTVKEDEPLEKEVAVDPEMLGKVFENLLEVKDRKSKGTYYTPREIVHYMCQESLINYLVNECEGKVGRKGIETLIQYGETAVEHDSRVEQEGKETETYSYKLPESIRKNAQLLDDKLKNIRVCDPAIGSGAFPVGMMNEIIRTRNTLTNYLEDKKDRSIYNFKRDAIQNSLYGVDIDPGAVEIAKLRLWLSLVVDEEDIKQIKPLPNLDYKIVCGNSLLSVNKQNLFVDYNLKQIEKLKEELFNETNIRKKQEYKEQIDNLIAEVTDNNKTFDFEIYFSEIFENENNERKGFDVVIANPPYVGQKMNNDIFRIVKASKLGVFHQRRMDLFYFFFHLGLDILREGGILSFITTNYYITATGADKLRKDIQNRSTLLNLINFNELKIFESASGQHNLITILQKGHHNRLARTSITAERGFLGAEILKNIVDGTDLKTMYFHISQDKLFDNGMIRLTAGGADDVLDKVLTKSNKLSTVCDISTGIQTGAHKLSEAHIKKYGNLGNKDDGIFVLNKDELFKNNISQTDPNIKPWFKNSDIKKYVTNLENDEYLLYVLSHQASKEIIRHFEKYKPLLINRNIESGVQVSVADYDAFVSNRKKLKYVMQHSSFKQGFYYNISYPRNPTIFESEKIVSSQWAKSNIFGWNNIPWYGGTDVCVITLKNQIRTNYSLKFILGILNSKIIYKWLYLRGKRKGELLELTVTPLTNIPIPLLDTPARVTIANQINSLVEQILTIKYKNSSTGIMTLEKQIDQLVYKLYDLTPEEIEIIEGKEVN